MRGKTGASIVFLCVFAFAQDFHGQVRYLPDHIGKAYRFELCSPWYPFALTDPYGLTATETKAMNQAMQQVADFLLAQPAVSPPRGFMANGDMRIVESSLCPKAPCRNVPIPGWVEMRFFECIEFEGKPLCGGRAAEFGNSVDVWINTPAVAHLEVDPHRQLFDNTRGPTLLRQTKNYGEIQGLTWYGESRGGFDYLVAARSPKPFFLPVNQETYVPMLIRYWEKKEAELVADSQKKNPYADDAAYQKWLAQRGELLRQAKAFCELLRKGGNPKEADECLRKVEKNDEETGKNLKMMIESAKKSDTQMAVGISDALQDVRDVLDRLRMQQANMTPAERRTQARWDSSLKFSDDLEGRPLVMVNPEIIDRTLPRTAVQLIVVSFHTDRDWYPFLHPEDQSSARPGSAAALGLFKLQQTSNWGTLQDLLAK